MSINGKQVHISSLEQFRKEVQAVAVRRDLATATEYGVALNRLVAPFDRRVADLTAEQRTLLELAHSHLQAMMNCPRRMRLDDTWQDDFVVEAQKAAETLIILAHSLGQEPA